MSPSSTERRRSTARKLAISAAALVVTVLPTACSGSAYADSLGDGNGASTAPAAGGHSGHGSQDQSASKQTSKENEKPADPQGKGSNGSDNSNGSNDSKGSDDSKGSNDSKGSDKPAAPVNNGLDVLGTDCTGSKLPPHDGFQLAPRCVSTSFGEVAAEDKSPSLLITDAPRKVRVKETFTIKVSTRNLVRDRFLGAAAGGYYLESSFLNKDGLQRGHFHTACRTLDATDVAPDAAPAPEFFLATQDNGGGAEPDTVTITVTGLPTAGTAQCAVWAGDGSHRIPMMQRADQTPAFDAVRIEVR
ncbi:MAG: hypothetical protein QOI36_2963 [Pseudonocardiales bacterium]|nr:hypothetical protein [Pseudonocardiales bacterium]